MSASTRQENPPASSNSIPAPCAGRVQGRADAATGAPLVLGETSPAIGRNQLWMITDGGRYYIDVVVPVRLWDIATNDLEWLNDTVTERIVGDSGALDDLSFARYHPADADVLAPSPFKVFIRVTAAWDPVDVGGDDEGDPQSDAGTPSHAEPDPAVHTRFTVSVSALGPGGATPLGLCKVVASSCEAARAQGIAELWDSRLDAADCAADARVVPTDDEDGAPFDVMDGDGIQLGAADSFSAAIAVAAEAARGSPGVIAEVVDADGATTARVRQIDGATQIVWVCQPVRP